MRSQAAARNVFMRCQRRQQEGEFRGGRQELQRRVSSKSQTLIQQIHLVLSLKRAAKATKPHSLPNEGVLMPEHSFPSGCKSASVYRGDHSSCGGNEKKKRHKEVRRGSRRSNDKQLSLNKAFRNIGRATTRCLSCLSRPPLPLACLLPRRSLTYTHPSRLTGVRHRQRLRGKSTRESP